MLLSVFDTEIPQIPEYEGCTFDASFLGGKGFGLWRMQQMGVNVPPALIIPTAVCVQYMKSPKTVMKKIASQYIAIQKFFQGHIGYMPLLSVRSGARVSMPGMMDTILNVGIDATTQEDWLKRLGEAALNDSAKRLITMYGDVVMGLSRHDLEAATDPLAFYTENTGEAFPDAKGQVLGAIEAVFKSWNNDRAKFYRKMHNIPEEWGTAVVIQAMVFGNMNDKSCTGVMFTRNPDTGSGGVVGEFLVNAQGEDVVAGIRTPQNLTEMADWDADVAAQVLNIASVLEDKMKDVQDIEFTVQDSKLYILQTRNAKRSARAAVRIAVEMAEEGVISPEEAVKRVTFKELDLSQQSIIDPKFKVDADLTGIPACSGVVSAKPVFSSDAAINCKEPCILVTAETTPNDIAGMNAALGVVTMTGGATSHAAVVARGMNKPCVVGVGASLDDFKDKAIISFDGATGRVWMQPVPVVDGTSNPHAVKLREMCMALAEKTGEIVTLLENRTDDKPALLDLGGMLYKGSAALAEVIANAAKDRPRVVVDFTSPDLHSDLYQSMFMSEQDDSGKVLDKGKVIEAVAAKIKGLGEKVTLILDGTCEKDDLGVPVLRATTDLKALILAESEIIWAGNADKASQKVLKWQQEAGLKFSSVGQKSTTGTSYMSEKQVLAGMLKQ